VDLREGESFAIAGLIDNRVTDVVSKIPGIGNIPILGSLFKTRQTNKTNTELLVVVTPQFVKPFGAGETVPMPNFPKPFLDGNVNKKDAPVESPKFVGARGHESGGGPKQ
jgi:pilus assembly protein CpaC